MPPPPRQSRVFSHRQVRHHTSQPNWESHPKRRQLCAVRTQSQALRQLLVRSTISKGCQAPESAWRSSSLLKTLDLMQACKKIKLSSRFDANYWGKKTTTPVGLPVTDFVFSCNPVVGLLFFCDLVVTVLYPILVLCAIKPFWFEREFLVVSISRKNGGDH